MVITCAYQLCVISVCTVGLYSNIDTLNYIGAVCTVGLYSNIDTLNYIGATYMPLTIPEMKYLTFVLK